MVGRDNRGNRGNDGLAGTDVALKQPIHGPGPFDVFHDLPERFFLRWRELKGELREQSLLSVRYRPEWKALHGRRGSLSA